MNIIRLKKKHTDKSEPHRLTPISIHTLKVTPLVSAALSKGTFHGSGKKIPKSAPMTYTSILLAARRKDAFSAQNPNSGKPSPTFATAAMRIKDAESLETSNLIAENIDSNIKKNREFYNQLMKQITVHKS